MSTNGKSGAEKRKLINYVFVLIAFLLVFWWFSHWVSFILERWDRTR
jgi:hypothetical protein